MTKNEITQKLAEQYSLPKGTVAALVDSFTEIVLDAMSRNEDVVLRRFGRFTTRRSKSKQGWDFGRKKSVTIDERCVPVFRFSKQVLRDLND